MGRHYNLPILIRQERMELVKDLVINGLSISQIHQFVNTPTDKRESWNVNKKWVSAMIKRAEIEIEIETQSHRPTEIAKAIRRINLIFAQCLKSQNYQGCLNAQKELNELLGLKAPTLQQIDLTTKGQSINQQPDYSNLNDEELRIMAEIQEKLHKPKALPEP